MRAACRAASCQEVIRRYYKSLTDLKMGREKQETVDKLISIAEFNGIEPVMVVTKCDLNPEYAKRIEACYKKAGFEMASRNFEPLKNENDNE